MTSLALRGQQSLQGAKGSYLDLRLVPEKLLEPLSWSKPRKVFVNSMSDLFQEAVPEDFIVAVAAVHFVNFRIDN